MMLAPALLLTFVSISLLAAFLVPRLVTTSSQINKNQAQDAVGQVGRFLSEEEIKKMYQLALLGPVIVGFAGAVLFPARLKWIGIIAGVFLGYVLPRMYVGHYIKKRQQKFNDQLMDAIMIMSSSFRGGLSLVQAFESVVEEMPEPSKSEFGVVIGENKMGVSLDESLNRLYRRMPSPGMQQVITAILLARETGGNLSLIFARIVNSIRETKRIERSMKTLTVQGKIQAAVMTGLPIFFFFTVSGTNPHFFDVMFNTPRGHQLMILCLILWSLGAVSILKISTFKEA